MYTNNTCVCMCAWWEGRGGQMGFRGAQVSLAIHDFLKLKSSLCKY